MIDPTLVGSIALVASASLGAIAVAAAIRRRIERLPRASLRAIRRHAAGTREVC